jgi:parallel beta-helix repeat protein
MKLILSILLGAACSVSAQVPGNAIWVDGSSKASTADGNQKSPFKTIARAMRAVKLGSTIVVRKGIYREDVSMRGGAPGKPVILMGMPGERVVISGMRKVGSWKSVGKGVYKTTIDWNPTKLFVGFAEQPVARLPKEGWWSVEKKSEEAFQTNKLKAVPGKLAGVKSFIWTQHGNILFTIDIKSIDRKSGTARFAIPSKWFKLKGGDKIYLKNHPALISKSGEWAVEQSNGKYNLYFMPASKADLAKVEVPKSKRNVINVYRQTDIKIRGLEVAGGLQNGIATMKSERIEIENCLLHDNARNGINCRDTKNSSIHNNLATKNYCGIVVTYSSNIKVEKNEIGFNYMDGLLVSWRSKDILVRRNYLHDHMLWGHPDNMQMYRDVKNVRIVDNLFLTGGQALMIEQADNIIFKGNMVVGGIANQVIFGHKNTTNAKVLNNTIAFAGYSPLSFTAQNYELFANVLVLGHKGLFFGYKKDSNLVGKNNLFWAAPGRDAGIAFVRYHNTFKRFKDANPQAEKNSLYANPDFINAPSYFHVLNSSKIPACTREKLYLRFGTGDYKAGDFIEINFDGILRKVVKLSPEYLIISPPLKKKPIKSWMVANWKKNNNFNMDLRLKPNSPGAKLNNGKPSGSVIDIQAFKRGDFNGNGKRDIPMLPADVKMPQY